MEVIADRAMPMKIRALALIGLLLAAPCATAQTPPGATTPAPAAAPVISNPAAGANLNISPKRVTFDRNHRAGSVFIFNQGTAPGAFDISLVDRVMMPDGQILGVDEAQAKPETKVVADRVRSAQAVLQVSPRRVTLAPGQGQTIRLRLAGGPTDAGGVELRSHLTIATLPPRDAGTTAEQAAASTTSTELSFQINALFGLSVPVIVRPGDLDVRAGLENANVTFEQLGGSAAAPGPRTPVLNLDLVRLGANSLFGNVEVRVQGQPARTPALGLARGVGVYTEIDRRAVHIVLSRAPAPGERLEITFTDDDTTPGKLLARLAL